MEVAGGGPEPANERWQAAPAGEAVRDAVRQQFGAVAANYVTSAVHAQGHDLAELVRVAAPTGTEEVLDLGTATGHAALAIAPHVRSVIGVDITPEMLEQGRRLAAERGVTNVIFRQADVEQLPVVDHSIDLVISRYSAHHWPHPERALFQVVRVLRPGGRCLLIDVVGPPDPAADRFVDTVERLRDPSHVRDWTIAEWQAMLEAAGLPGRVVQQWPLEMDLDSWLERMQTPAEQAARIRALIDEAPDAIRATFNLHRRAGKQFFSLPCAMFLATLPA